MKRGTIGISWLNEELKAAWVDASGVVATWTSPTRVVDGTTLSEAIGEAVKRSGGAVRRAQVVIDQRNLLFHVQETPPASGRVVNQVLGRLVAENRFYDEPAVWARVSLPAAAKRQRWLLSLMPQSIWNEVELACHENELQLTGLYPVAALMTQSLARVGAEADEAVLLVANLGGSHGLLVGRGTGQVLFARSIADSGPHSRMRLDQEINRTLHFAQQRFSVQVNRLVAIGTGCYGELAGRTIREGLNPECLLSEEAAGGLALEVAELRDTVSLNFAHGRQRQPAWVRPALAVGMAVLLMVSGITALMTDREARSRERDVARMVREGRAAAEIAANKDTLRREANQLRAVTRLIGLPDEPAVVPTFLRYLRATVPQSVRFTALTLSQSTNGWNVLVEGMTREKGSGYLALVESLEKELTEGVFRVKISDSSQRRSIEGASAQMMASVGSRGALAAGERPFFLTGSIQ